MSKVCPMPSMKGAKAMSYYTTCPKCGHNQSNDESIDLVIQTLN